MQRLDLFGVERLDYEAAKGLIDHSGLSHKEKIELDDLIKAKLDDAAVQALIYTIHHQCSRGSLTYSITSILNPDTDAQGRKLAGIQKQIAPLTQLVERDIMNGYREGALKSLYIFDERTDKGRTRTYNVRFDGSPDKFFISVNLANGNTQVIFPSSNTHYFPWSRIEEKDVFSNGPIDCLLLGGFTILPVTGITEISNIGMKVTYDKDGKHECRHSIADLEM